MNLYTKKKNNFLQADLFQRVFLKIIVLFILLILLNVFQAPVRNIFYSSTYPFSHVFLESGNGVSGFFSTIFNVGSLQKQKLQYQKENQELLGKVASLEQQLGEQRDTEAMAQVTTLDQFDTVLSHVVGLDVAHDTMVIDVGSHDGILENMPLISKEKVVYGKVVKVYENFSQVLLVSSKTSIFNVKVQSDDPEKPVVFGAVRGLGDGRIFLDLVDSESELNEGDVLVASGLEGIFPAQLLVGKVLAPDRSDVKPFQTARIQPFFDLQNPDNLFVITNYLKK